MATNPQDLMMLRMMLQQQQAPQIQGNFRNPVAQGIVSFANARNQRRQQQNAMDMIQQMQAAQQEQAQREAEANAYAMQQMQGALQAQNIDPRFAYGDKTTLNTVLGKRMGDVSGMPGKQYDAALEQAKMQEKMRMVEQISNMPDSPATRNLLHMVMGAAPQTQLDINKQIAGLGGLQLDNQGKALGNQGQAITNQTAGFNLSTGQYKQLQAMQQDIARKQIQLKYKGLVDDGSLTMPQALAGMRSDMQLQGLGGEVPDNYLFGDQKQDKNSPGGRLNKTFDTMAEQNKPQTPSTAGGWLDAGLGAVGNFISGPRQANPQQQQSTLLRQQIQTAAPNSQAQQDALMQLRNLRGIQAPVPQGPTYGGEAFNPNIEALFPASPIPTSPFGM